MNWEAIGAVGEIVGAFAVFLTLIYLATQIRHSNTLMRAQHRETNRQTMLDISRPVIEDGEFARLIESARESAEHLDDADKRRVRLQAQAELLAAQSLFLRGELMGEARMAGISVNLAKSTVRGQVLGRQIWEQTDWDAGFRAAVDAALAADA